MSIIIIRPENKSNSTLELAPRRKFSSSSSGITGSINVIVNRSNTQKDNIDMREGLTNTEGPQKFSLNTFEGRRKAIYDGTFDLVGQGTIFDETPTAFDYDLQMGLLLDGRNNPELLKKKYGQLNLNFAEKGYSDLPMHPRNSYKLFCSRSVPGTDFANKEYRKKEIIRNILDPSYSIGRPGAGWGYTNFHCLNFFKTSSTKVPAVIYNSSANEYLPTSSLQIDFRIKVNRNPTETGTVLHLPGAYAVSIVTGSTTDQYDRSTYYKLLLQLGTDSSQSSLPNSVDLSVPNLSRGKTQIYQSTPNITSSMWHDCSIRISEKQNNLTGSFIIDGQLAGFFEPTGSFSVKDSLAQTAKILSVGAFYNGTSLNSEYFFNAEANSKQGVTITKAGSDHPASNFSNPLDAEVFEIKVSDSYRSLNSIRDNLGLAITSSKDTLFHLPLLYTSDSPINRYNSLTGDIISANGSSTKSSTLSSFFSNIPTPVSLSFDSPFNTHHSNIGGFININAQSFLKDFKTKKYPYLHFLSSSVRAFSTQHEMSSSWSLFDQHQKRNTLLMPCDDGSFTRDFTVYPSSELSGSVIGKNKKDIIQLTSLGNFSSNHDSKLVFVDEGWKYFHSENLDQNQSGPLLAGQQSAVQSRPAIDKNPTTIPAQRFFDPKPTGLIGSSEQSSNMVVIFSIPTLFYGNRLKPGSIKMYSDLYQGSGNISGGSFVKGTDYRMRVNLCDDKYGNVIRCDTSGSLATSNFVGSVYYEDGIIALKSPHLFNFGAHNFTLEFEGVQNIHMLELVVPIHRNLFNSSSNPNYNKYKPFADSNEEADSFVYMSTVNLHDSNLNVVGKARMAQPIIKRIKDKYMLRVKFDF